MEKGYLKIIQNKLTLYIVCFSTEELLDMTEIEYYNADTSEGYQRPPFPSHFKKIARYLIEDNLPVLPTAILTAIDPSKIREEGIVINIKGKLRVVDGQHRIEGIKYLRNINEAKYNEILEYQFPVLIMAIDKDMRDLEISTFININSKAKRVSTDLAKELWKKVNWNKISQKRSGDVLTPEECEVIATQVAQILNRNESCIWYDSIRMGDEATVSKPISVTAFTKSIKDIISILSNKFSGTEELVDETIKFLIDVWNEVTIRWPECFDDSYDTFNIKKGIGVYSIHLVLKECVTKNEGNIDNALEEFRRMLKESQVLYTDWMTGGKFTGMSSGQAIKRISAYIKNEVSKEEFFN